MKCPAARADRAAGARLTSATPESGAHLTSEPQRLTIQSCRSKGSLYPSQLSRRALGEKSAGRPLRSSIHGPAKTSAQGRAAARRGARQPEVPRRSPPPPPAGSQTTAPAQSKCRGEAAAARFSPELDECGPAAALPVQRLPGQNLAPRALIDQVVDGHHRSHVVLAGRPALAAHGIEEHLLRRVDPGPGARRRRGRLRAGGCGAICRWRRAAGWVGAAGDVRSCRRRALGGGVHLWGWTTPVARSTAPWPGRAGARLGWGPGCWPPARGNLQSQQGQSPASPGSRLRARASGCQSGSGGQHGMPSTWPGGRCTCSRR